jgi:hypothetical protein
VFLVGTEIIGLHLFTSCSIMKPFNYIDCFLYYTGLFELHEAGIDFDFKSDWS